MRIGVFGVYENVIWHALNLWCFFSHLVPCLLCSTTFPSQRASPIACEFLTNCSQQWNLHTPLVHKSDIVRHLFQDIMLLQLPTT